MYEDNNWDFSFRSAAVSVGTRRHKPAATDGRRCTLWLAELVEDHDVVGVVEVFGQGLDVLSAQSVGHEDSSAVSVRPVDTILEEQKSRFSCCCCFRYRLWEQHSLRHTDV